MRKLFRFLWKSVISLFAIVGLGVCLIVLVAVVLLIPRVTDFVGAKPQVPQSAVVMIDLADGVTEQPQPTFPLQGLGGLSQPLIVSQAELILERAADDPRVRGVVARLGVGSLGLAQAQELRQAIESFRESGKFAYAFAETFGEAGNGTLLYYLASAFDEVWLQPSGELAMIGFQAQQPYVREALDDLGITPRLGQRKEYKGIANIFTDRSQPAPVRENLSRLVDSMLERTVADIARARRLQPSAVRAAVDTAPHTAKKALEMGLVDQLGYWDQFESQVDSLVGDNREFITLNRYDNLARSELPKEAPRVAVIHGIGSIMLGESQGGPFRGATTLGGRTLSQAIGDAIEDPTIDAIVLRVSSPGGSYVASDQVWRQVVRAREADKPVVVSMGNVAASGGYFIAMAAERVIAQPGTVTGSIGVAGGKFVITDLLDDLGVEIDGVKAGVNADYMDFTQDFTPQQWVKFQEMLDRVYIDFTAKVSVARDLDTAAVEAAAGGRVWTGADAVTMGLVDELGGFRLALTRALEAAGQDPEAPARLVYFPKIDDPLEALISKALKGDLPGALGRLSRLTERMELLLAPYEPALRQMGEPGARRLSAPVDAQSLSR